MENDTNSRRGFNPYQKYKDDPQLLKERKVVISERLDAINALLLSESLSAEARNTLLTDREGLEEILSQLAYIEWEKENTTI